MLSFRSLLTGFLVLVPFIALLIAIAGRHPMPSSGTVPSDGMASIAVISGAGLSEGGTPVHSASPAARNARSEAGRNR